MNTNRRNYYRILHVQPEAPLEVIRASYRALMGTLRRHPDLGGDHAGAVLLNEAFRVLSDPARRAAYDQAQRRQIEAARGATALLNLRGCPLCGLGLPLAIRPDTRCQTCGSPLAAPARSSSCRHELIGRRGSVRRSKNETATAHVGWPSLALQVRWRDLSPTGLSLFAPTLIPVRRSIRVIDDTLEVVGVVVGCHARGPLYTVHARLLTALAL